MSDTDRPLGSAPELSAVDDRSARAPEPRLGADRRDSESRRAPTTPRATYRLQMHREFTFDDACAITPYLARLGISHIYLSPIQTAQPGSTHGYDIVDHGAINPELGGLSGFYRFSDAARGAGLGLIVDIVPNHAGVGGSSNRSWLSVLEWGPRSPAARMFDIDWERAGARGKLVVPFLGDRYGLALERGEIRLAFNRETGGFDVWHFDHQFPICPLHYPDILDATLTVLGAPADGQARDLRAISEALRAMSTSFGSRRGAGPIEKVGLLKSRLKALVAAGPGLASAIEQTVASFNGVAGEGDSFARLHRLIERQHYRLAHWRVCESELNYRRFFEISTLAGIRAEDPEVFEATHRAILRLVEEGRIDGLRVDHIDGLADPECYLKRLRAAVGPGIAIVVEKILEPGERLRPWPIAGTTGYEALNLIDGLFVDAQSRERFTLLRQKYTGSSSDFHSDLREIKSELLRRSFGSEFETLVGKLKQIADASPYTRDFTQASLARVVDAMISALPAYRSYLTDADPDPQDVRLIGETAAEAKERIARADAAALAFFTDLLLAPAERDAALFEEALIGDVRRLFQQLSGPVMAKSLEDTLFYRDTRFVALNEVGGNPDGFGVSSAAFHAANQERRRLWPHAMIASQTHDSKRGEDFRARLFAISEAPDKWEEIVRAWFETPVGDGGPDRDDRYFMLQTIVGAWPMELLEDIDPNGLEAYVKRLEDYFVKAFREAKRHTSWVDPNASYEQATAGFLRAALAADGAFAAAAMSYIRRLAQLGVLNSLARLTLKCTIPGAPDTYQGSEFWDFSLVDPDNRRPVDFRAREEALGAAGSPAALMESWRDGRVKQALLARLLADRRSAPELYAEGDYRPLCASGERAGHVIAFSRNTPGDSRVVVVGRLFGSFSLEESLRAGASAPIPSGQWRDLCSDRDWNFASGAVELAALLFPLPIAVLRPLR